MSIFPAAAARWVWPLVQSLLARYNGRGQFVRASGGASMYVSLLRLFVEVSQKSPLLYVGLVVLLMASWGLIVSAILEIVVRVFDIKS